MSQPLAFPLHSCSNIVVHVYLANIVENILLWGTTSIDTNTSLVYKKATPPSSCIALELLRVHRLSYATPFISQVVNCCNRIVLRTCGINY